MTDVTSVRRGLLERGRSRGAARQGSQSLSAASAYHALAVGSNLSWALRPETRQRREPISTTCAAERPTSSALLRCSAAPLGVRLTRRHRNRKGEAYACWLRLSCLASTGDLGRVEDDGFLHLLGRRKELGSSCDAELRALMAWIRRG